MMLVATVSVLVIVEVSSIGAAEPSMPWQCTSYTYSGNSQAECIESFNERQQNPEGKIAQLERRLKRQEITLQELNDRIHRQASRVHRQRDFSDYPPSYDYVPAPLFGRGSSFYGYGAPWQFGAGPLPFLPPLAIWID